LHLRVIDNLAGVNDYLAERENDLFFSDTKIQRFDWGKAGLGVSSIRVLVVEDFLPFRQFIRSTVEKTNGLQVICEVSDGLEAVQKAEELKPDLILLDVGLPTLNGIEAARQIRELSPESKVLFVSQESSADIVREALSTGAQGYVFKTRAGSDLLPAIEAVILGKRFVSTA